MVLIKGFPTISTAHSNLPTSFSFDLNEFSVKGCGIFNSLFIVGQNVKLKGFPMIPSLLQDAA